MFDANGTWHEPMGQPPRDPVSPEAAFRAAEQIVEDEIVRAFSDRTARGAPPPRHRGPDGPHDLRWLAGLGILALAVAGGVGWFAFRTVTTFLGVTP